MLGILQVLCIWPFFQFFSPPYFLNCPFSSSHRACWRGSVVLDWAISPIRIWMHRPENPFCGLITADTCFKSPFFLLELLHKSKNTFYGLTAVTLSRVHFLLLEYANPKILLVALQQTHLCEGHFSYQNSTRHAQKYSP